MIILAPGVRFERDEALERFISRLRLGVINLFSSTMPDPAYKYYLEDTLLPLHQRDYDVFRAGVEPISTATRGLFLIYIADSVSSK